MAPTTVTDHARIVLMPFHPVAYTAGGQPVYPARGGRGGGGIEMIVDDRDDDSDPFDERDDDDDEDDDYAPTGRRRYGRDTDDDDDDDDEDQDDEDGAEDEDDDFVPPSRDAVARMEEAIKRNNGQLMKLRHASKALKRLGVQDADELNAWLIERGIDPENGGRLAGYGEDGPEGEPQLDDGDAKPRDQRTRQQIVRDIKTAENRGRESAEGRYKPAVALYAATAALREAGWLGESTSLGLRLLDVDKLDIDFNPETGEVEVFGLDEQIEQVRKELPERFRRQQADSGEPPARRRTGGRTARGAATGGAARVDGGDRSGRQRQQTRGWLNQLDSRISGGR